MSDTFNPLVKTKPKTYKQRLREQQELEAELEIQKSIKGLDDESDPTQWDSDD